MIISWFSLGTPKTLIAFAKQKMNSRSMSAVFFSRFCGVNVANPVEEPDVAVAVAVAVAAPDVALAIACQGDTLKRIAGLLVEIALENALRDPECVENVVDAHVVADVIFCNNDVPNRVTFAELEHVAGVNVKHAVPKCIQRANWCLQRCKYFSALSEELEVLKQREARAIADAAEIEAIAHEITMKKWRQMNASATLDCK